MGITRPTENVIGPFSLSSTLPTGDIGNATVVLDGALGATFECTAASSGTGTVEVQHHAGGDWFTTDSWEVASGVATKRTAGTTITLADNDILLVPCPGFHAVRFNLGGTSATVCGRTCEHLTDFLLTILISQASGGGALRANKGKQFTTITSSTSETTIVSAGGTGVFKDVYAIVISNTSASACNVTIKDATGGSTVDVIAVPAGETRGFTVSADSAIPQAAAANNWTATCSASVASINVGVLYVNN